MKVAGFYVRLRLPKEGSDGQALDEAQALLFLRYRLMDIKGALSVEQQGPVDDGMKSAEPVNG